MQRSCPTTGTDLAIDTGRQEVAMIPASSPVVDVFREYSKLYALRESLMVGLKMHKGKTRVMLMIKHSGE